MKVTMRLYRIHDLDLLYLYKLQGFSIQKAIKDSLTAHVLGKELIIEYPQETDIALPRSAMIHIYLSEKKDKEIINWLKNISKGYRNSLLKNIVRYYLVKPSIDPYLMDNNIQMYGVLPKRNKIETENSNKIINEFLTEEKKESSDSNPPEEIKINKDSSQNEEVSFTEETTDDFDLFSTFDDMMSSFN